MQFVLSTVPVLAILLAMTVSGLYRAPVFLLALAPMGMLAAVNLPGVGGLSILAIDLAVVVLFAMLLSRPGGGGDMVQTFAPRGIGLALLAFLAWAALATVFFPRVFAGETEVFSIGRVANSVGIVVRPLLPGAGNLSQLMRMALSVAAFVAVAALVRRRPDPDLILTAMTVATAVHVVMGVADVVTNWAGLEWLLSWARTANYSLTLGQRMAGLNRMIGGFPEASAYGYLSVGLFGFWLSWWFSGQGRGRWPAFWTLATAAVVLRSTSSSAYVGAAALICVFAIHHILAVRDGTVDRRTAAIIAGVLAVLPLLVVGSVVAYALSPAIADFVDRILLDKLSSSSGTERMSWNRQALVNLRDTWMLGAGLGSVRASNWVAATLGTTGIVGLALYVAFLVRLFAARVADPQNAALTLALKFGCAGLLLRALVVKATPNLEIVFFVVAGCVAALCVPARDTAAVPRLPAGVGGR